FLTAQRKDLVDSIAATNDAIRKIDKTTRERFQEAFTVINQNFEVTFTTLFGGGKAGLVLLDESDALESGIDIIASPPGKRLQSIQLLSGGEKALTAMALMFAIFKYRPSPFCLLDEIDAPLDDANIGRFVEMLQGMQEHTQFILITHNRKTMEIADRLYGVTMAAVLALGWEALAFPFVFYRTWLLDRKYGLSSEPVTAWLADQAKALALALVFAVGAAVAVYVSIRLSPQRWWLIAAVLFVAVAIV